MYRSTISTLAAGALPLLGLLAALAAAPAEAVSAREQDYQDWRLRCEKRTDADAESCVMFQAITATVKDRKQRILNVAVRYPAPEQPPMLFFSVPLGVYLPGGLLLQIDEGTALRLQIEVCNPNGCHTRLALEEPLIDDFKVGRQAKVTFQDGRQREVAVPVSLTGFTAAFKALK